MRTLTSKCPPADSPLDNPLKGWAPWARADDRQYLPASLAYFDRSWRELEPSPGRYAFDAWERDWDNPNARGRHVVLRLYIDYPSRPSGVPEGIRATGVRLTPYSDYGGGFAPDYDDPRLLGPLLDLIAAMGSRYNGNSRVAFVQIGTLGFWGEWHTYPHDNLFASPATQAKVVEAFHRAFPDKLLLGRNPGNAVLGKQPWIGYHDDLFPADTDTGKDWEFLPSMRSAGRTNNWQRAPIGAEMVPGQAAKYLGTDAKTTVTMADAIHLSWIGPYCPALEPNLSATQRRIADALVRRLGYEFRLQSAVLEQADTTRPILTIAGENRGIAPFYSAWPVEFALLRPDGRMTPPLETAPLDVRTWLPGPFRFSSPLPLPVPPQPGDQIAIRIRDPWPDAQYPLRFANAFRIVNGWSILGPLRAAA